MVGNEEGLPDRAAVHVKCAAGAIQFLHETQLAASIQARLDSIADHPDDFGLDKFTPELRCPEPLRGEQCPLPDVLVGR